MKIMFMYDLSLCLLFLCLVPVALSQNIDENDVILCLNEKCSEPVAEARATVDYFPDMKYKIGYKKGTNHTIFGRIPHKKLALLYDGGTKKYGLAPVSYLREIRTFTKNKPLVKVPVTTFFSNLAQPKPVNADVYVPYGVAAEVGNQAPPPPVYETVDNTSLAIGTDGEPISPTSTQGSSIEATKSVEKGDEDGDEDDDEDEDEEETEENSAKSENSNSTDFQTTIKIIDKAIKSGPGQNAAEDDEIIEKYSKQSSTGQVSQTVIQPATTAPPSNSMTSSTAALNKMDRVSAAYEGNANSSDHVNEPSTEAVATPPLRPSATNRGIPMYPGFHAQTDYKADVVQNRFPKSSQSADSFAGKLEAPVGANRTEKLGLGVEKPAESAPSQENPSELAPVKEKPADSVPANENTANPTTYKQKPPELASSEETTRKPASSEETATKPASSQETTTKPASSQETTTKPSSAEETPSEPASSQETTTEPASTEETARKPASSEETARKPASSEETIRKPASSQETTRKTASSQETTTKPSSTEETPSEPASSEETTRKPSSTEETARKPASSEETAKKPGSSEETARKPASSQETTRKTASSQETATKPASSQETTTKPASSQETTTKPSSTEETTTKPSSTEETTTKPSSTEETARKPASSEETTTEPASSEETTRKPFSSQETTTQPASSQETTTKPSSAEVTPSEPASSQETTTEPSSTEETTTKPSSTEETARKPASSEETTTEPASSEETTRKPFSSQETTTKPASSQETTTKPSSAEETPSEPASSQETTTEPASTEETPSEPVVNSTPASQLFPDSLHQHSDPEIENPQIENQEVEAKAFPTEPENAVPSEFVVETPETPVIERIDTDPEPESPGFFAFLQNLFSSQPNDEIVENLPVNVPEGECITAARLETSCDDAPSGSDILQLFDKTVPENSYILLYVLSTSLTVLLFLLGYYFLERTRQDGPLVAKVNQLTHELQVAKAERNITTVDESRSSELNASLNEAYEELNELKSQKNDLESQLEAVQQELDATAEAGLEMNRMLSELLTQRSGSDTLLKSVEKLQGQLNAQQLIIDGMNKSLTEKKVENEALQSELGGTQAKVDNLEEELNDMRNNLNVLLKEKESAMFELERLNLELQVQLTAVRDDKKRDNQLLDKLNEKLLIRDSEFQALKQTIDDLRAIGGVDVDAVYNLGSVRAELVRALAEKEQLQERFGEEVGARKLLEDHAKAIDHEVLSLRLSFETVEREKLEAETKLTVLSSYFKEKENQLHKELGIQEAMWAQKQGDETSIFETIKSLKDEVENYNFDSFNLSNELISFTNSASSLCTDAANLISISPKLTEPLSSLNTDPWNYPNAEDLSIRSLPLKATPKPRALTRRKSSVDFEARLERAETMALPVPQPRSVPDDLLKLTELQTVRASPFRDSEQPAKCLELVGRFETLGKPNGGFVDYAPVALKRASRSDKSESEDSQSTGRDGEILASTARVEFDIKVVANASSGVMKFKKKPSRPKNGAPSETLKKEILDQERGLKGQIATLEKKAHENWVAARQAERRLEESKQEAGQLRNMLTLMDKTPDSESKPGGRLAGDLNGDDVVLPPFLVDGSSPLSLPPLPLDPSLLPPGFMPPFLPPSLAGFMPPPPSHPGEHRPPPLGRMSSPPPPIPMLSRFSPAPGDFNFDGRFPPRSFRSPPIDPERFHHQSPSAWEDRSSFRPVAYQRESRNDYQDSDPSSRPSSAGSIEKPTRRRNV